MATFAKGKRSLAISDRSGLQFPYHEMVFEWNGSFVHYSEYEPKHPQLDPKPIGADPQGLQFARPSRTEFPTADILPNNPFTMTAGSNVVTVNEPNSGRVNGDIVRFSQVKTEVGGLPITALELNTTLAIGITASETTALELSDATYFPTSGYLVIEKINPITGFYENEVIGYTSKTGNILSGLTRGTITPTRGITLGNTTASAHGAGANVAGGYAITMVSTTIPNPGVPSTITVQNSYTFQLSTNAIISQTGGGVQVFAGPLDNRP